MKRLKNQLQYDASKYVHVAIIISLFLFSFKSYIAIILLLAECIYIFNKSKNILIYSLILALILFVRINMIDNQKTVLPIIGEITEVNTNSFYIKNDGLVLCYYDESYNLNPGMVVEVSGYISDTSTYQIMNTFDYETYLLSENIKSVVSVTNIDIIDYQFNLGTFKYRIQEYIDNKYSQETASFMKLFLLGEKTNLDDNFQNTISELGISHIFAISGMHLGLIVLLINGILKKFYISKEKNRAIIIAFLIIYNIITGFKISIIRASIQIIGIYLKDYFNILLTKTDLLSFSFVGFLVYNPYVIYNIGFQLSYIIAFSVIMGSHVIKDKRMIIRLTKTTLFANLISLPITLSFNNSIGLVFLFSNIFFILFVNYIFLPASFIVLLLPVLENNYLMIINFFGFCLNFFDKINILLNFNFTQQLYILLFWFLIYCFVTSTSKKRKLITVLLGILLILINITIPFKSETFVRFLDVKQGDAIHIHDGSYDMLIDTGDIDNYDTLVDYFKSYNIKDIDILLITHFHSDHYGELNEIIENFDVKTIYLNTTYKELSQNYVILETGDIFYCANNKFTVLSSFTNSTNENNNSIVLYGVIANERYLFTGDMESEIEANILANYDLEIDVLKVPHHGSNTSSTLAFIEAMNAPIGIISVGKDNDYNHPDSEILSRYLNNNTKIYRTDESGTITIYYYNFLNFRLIETYKKGKRPYYCL